MAFRKPTGCTSGKVRYPTEGDAIHQLARSRRWEAGMSAYHCGPCRAWHVGHTPGANKGRQK